MEGPEQKVKCPFNPLHVMPKESLQRHVIRCMVNYPGYQTCPYNALHRFKTKELLAEHMFTCDSREKYMFIEIGNNEMMGSTDIHIDNARKFNLEEENWDVEYR
nr:unnamed protein product [Callosobruchus analis]